MDKKELIEQGIDQIDLKYIEKAVEPQETKQPLRLRFSRIKKGWIAAAAALLVCLVSGGVILAYSDVFNVNRGDSDGAHAPAEDYSVNAPEANLAYNQYVLPAVMATREIDPPTDGLAHQNIWITVEGKAYETVYEPWYGGAYTNTHGELVVCLAKSAGQKAMEEGMAKLSPAITIFREVQYSYSELLENMEAILLYCQSEEYESEDFRILAWRTSDSDNTVVIRLTSTDKTVQDKIRKLVPHPDALQFDLQ